MEIREVWIENLNLEMAAIREVGGEGGREGGRESARWKIVHVRLYFFQ